ncbi:hypothetical protein Pla22_36080 [Rubripirellula amarantea]|uniref:AsmA-like C-terminal domain-containing protein n=1 Tax=Rubripirellula amarantea TaxID=2527999 RepID=A0A5C5WL28_9BACT|nr:hypothetical protein [Rubripirellula amarantea]TWT50865.1 hypothetical protein Pla22_36080 [Rubripirellula amarantea]
MKHPWRYAIARRCCYTVLAVTLVAVVFRNSIARYATATIGSRLLETELKVGSIEWGLFAVNVRDIRVAEPGSDQDQATVGRLAFALTPWQGIVRGVWVEHVSLSDPTLHLRFDSDGKLLSKFPSAGESKSGTAKIPIGKLDVRNATLAIHQSGKQTFTICGARLAARFDEEIRMHGDVPDFLGGTIEVKALVDATTLQGWTKLTVQNVRLDSEELARLPLTPAKINQEGVSATLTVHATTQHPANSSDLRQHELQCLISVKDIESSSLGTLCNEFTIRSVHRDAVLAVEGSGDMSGGNVDIAANCDWHTLPLSATASIAVDQSDLGRIASRIDPDLDFGGKFALQTQFKLTADTHTSSFSHVISYRVSDIRADAIPVEDLAGEIKCVGSLQNFDKDSLAGSLSGSLVSKGLSLKDLAQRFELPTSSGRIGLASRFDVDLSDLESPTAVTFDASLNASGLAMGEWRLQDTNARLTVKDGIASASCQDVVVLDSHSNLLAQSDAVIRVPLASEERATCNLLLSVLPTSSLAQALSVDARQCGGELMIAGAASCRVADVASPESWVAQASLRSRDLAFAGESFADVDATCELTEGRVSVPPFAMRWRMNECLVQAEGTVQDRLCIRGSLLTESFDVADVAELASQFSSTRMPASGTAQGSGQFELVTSPFNFVASGRMDLNHAMYAGSKIGHAQLDWNADPQGVRIQSSSKQFLGGGYDLIAQIQDLDWTTAVVEGRFRDIQAARLAAIVDRNLPVSGSLDGGIKVTSIASLETLQGEAWVQSRGLSVHRVPMELSAAKISIASAQAIVQGSGVIADGRFEGVANASLPNLRDHFQSDDPNLNRIPIVFQCAVERLPIESLTRHIDVPQELRTTRGTLAATLERDSSMLDGISLCKASGSVSELQVNRVGLSDRITSEITVYRDRLELRRIDGRFADGRLSGKADIRLGVHPSGTFELAANRVSLRRIAAPFSAQPIAGSGTVQIRGRVGKVISGRADLSLRHGVFAGVSIPEAKLPVDWSYSQPSKLARWQCRSGAVSAGGGNVRISSEGSFGDNLNMVTSLRIERVDSSKLIQGKSVGAGVISGDVSLRAKRAQSPKQISGTFDLTLENVKSMEMPVLDQLPNLVSLSPPRPGQGQDGGTVYGRISGGLVHVDQLAISQSNVQVLMSGNATLDGRLNFDVTASTQSDGPADQILELANSPLMLAAPAPITLVAKANELMKDRVVHVHVGGIASRPTLRLQPGKQLSQDAVRFFLKAGFGDLPAAIATRPNTQIRR